MIMPLSGFLVLKNKDILIHFINDMLEFSGEASIKEVSFLQTDQNPEIAAAKQSTLSKVQSFREISFIIDVRL